MTEKLNILLKAITSTRRVSGIADHAVTLTSHNLKWDHFDILQKVSQILIAR